MCAIAQSLRNLPPILVLEIHRSGERVFYDTPDYQTFLPGLLMSANPVPVVSFHYNDTG